MNSTEETIEEFKELHLKNPDVSTHHLCEWWREKLQQQKQEFLKDIETVPCDGEIIIGDSYWDRNNGIKDWKDNLKKKYN